MRPLHGVSPPNSLRAMWILNNCQLCGKYRTCTWTTKGWVCGTCLKEKTK